jgi:phosphatidate phosphatase APP1
MGKRVFPWLLDRAPLPAMLERQGITESDAARVAAVLRPHLGWTLRRRRALLGLVAVVLAAVAAFAIGRVAQPPPPWTFQGRVTDLQSQNPIPGVKVRMRLPNGKTYTGETDNQGDYTLQNLPPPQPAHIQLQFSKPGYISDSPIIESTEDGFDPKLEQQP